MKILIVDDSRAMRMILRRALRQAGFGSHDVEEATNGVEALKNIKSTSPDVVLCDWNMPEMSGLEVLETLRSEGSEIMFGFVTSESSDEMRQKAVEAGAKFLVAKPFTPEVLQTALSPILS